MPTWQNHTRVREPIIHCLFLQTLCSYSISKMQPGICQFFPTNACFQYGSNEQQPKKRRRKNNGHTKPFHLHNWHIFKKISFFLSVFSSGDTRRFPLRASENLKTAWTIPTLLFVWAKSILQTILKYPLPSAMRLALYTMGLQRDSIITHTTC